MSARYCNPFPEFTADCSQDPGRDDHLRFCGNGDFNNSFFGMGLHFSHQTDLTPPADAYDFSLLHDASPTSPSVHLQPCCDPPTAAGPSALTQALREWGDSAVNSAGASPIVDLLSEDMISACNMNSDPFNPLLLAEDGNMTPFNPCSSEFSSFDSSDSGIPIPQQNHTFSEYSFCSEPSLGYTGSSFNSDRSFDTLYAAHKQNEGLAPPQQVALAASCQPQASSWHSQPQLQRIKSVYVQRTRRLTADQPKRFAPTSVGSSLSKNTLSFIHCRPSEDSGRMLTYGTEHSPNAKRPRGRKSPLTPDQKKHAALMRRVKACDSCRQRKEKVRDADHRRSGNEVGGINWDRMKELTWNDHLLILCSDSAIPAFRVRRALSISVPILYGSPAVERHWRT
ncbi:hypothetical protein B0J12DRAFT_694948 [Macrophomina phaseolina]|uniref:BZIP domain-containing protein n=1 Tax=Macrophomina phaseolina TaxID=35725 RepID=A0ABQ8GQB8_9PEZI|nr:hypothetical protein B0J12DRAFT_694948 [Macrophomina phaseolina]